MTLLVWVLLVLAAFSIGLRTSSLFVPTRVHPIPRFVVALAIGALIAAAILEACSSYRIYDFGLGLLLSLSPVGAFDLARWWFVWRRR
ncbi:MAG: hypothetical protein ABI665_25315 [Vicinamibacterales bacterium]